MILRGHKKLYQKEAEMSQVGLTNQTHSSLTRVSNDMVSGQI